MGRPPYDDAMRYYLQQQRKQRQAVNAVIDKMVNGDPSDPLTQRLRHLAGLDKGRKEDNRKDNRSAGDDKP